MKAYLITPDTRTIDAVDISDIAGIKKHIGFDTLESDAVGSAGDRLYFDEECFLRGGGVRFQIDTLIPVSGPAVVIGTGADGSLRDVALGIDELRGRVRYL